MISNETTATGSFEQFCERNEVKPTNMKAEFYLAGFFAGQRAATERMWCMLPDELAPMMEQVDPQTRELLQEVASRYVVDCNCQRYTIDRVMFYKFTDDKYSILVEYSRGEDHRLDHIRDIKMMPF